MKYITKYLIFLTILFFPFQVLAEEVNIYLFHSKDCSHCKAERSWLAELEQEYDYLNVFEYEVTRDKDNSNLHELVKEKFGTSTPYVPFTVIGEDYFVGFTDATMQAILETIEDCQETEHRDIVDEAIHGNYDKVESSEGNEEDDYKSEIRDIPILGEVNVKNVSLPLLSIVIGFVDGFNPCAMWVLIFLISMLMGMKNKKRMWFLGLSFIVTSALVYLGFMFAWLNIAISLMDIMWIRLVVALVALVGAFINLKSWYKSVKQQDSGCEVVSDIRRKRIMKYIKKFTAEKSLFLAFVGIVGLAFAVNLIELACSARLPLLYTQILSLNNPTSIQSLFYVSLYIIFFLIDDIIIFTVAMVALQLTGISTKYTKYSHLIGGIIMLIVGILMIFKPSWLMFNF